MNKSNATELAGIVDQAYKVIFVPKLSEGTQTQVHGLLTRKASLAERWASVVNFLEGQTTGAKIRLINKVRDIHGEPTANQIEAFISGEQLQEA